MTRRPAQPRHRSSLWVSCHVHFDGQLYGAAADQVITAIIAPLLRTLRSTSRIGDAFIVRYVDEGPHIRVRAKRRRIVPEDVVRAELEALARRIASNVGVEVGVRWVAYEPETERYGGTRVLPVAERVFHATTNLALRVLPAIHGDQRRRLAQALMAMLLQLHVFLDGDPAGMRTFVADYMRGYLPLGSLQAGVPAAELASAYVTAYARQAPELVPFVRDALEVLQLDGELPSAHHALRRDLRQLRRELDRAVMAEATVDVPRMAGGVVRHVLPSLLHMTNNRLGVPIATEAFLAHLVDRALEEAVPSQSVGKRQA